MAFVFEAKFFPCWTVRERDVVVRDVVEEMNLFSLQHDPGSNGVNRCISPAFVEEPAVSVEAVKEVDVCRRTKPVEVSNLEIRPLYRLVSVYMQAQVLLILTK